MEDVLEEGLLGRKIIKVVIVIAHIRNNEGQN